MEHYLSDPQRCLVNKVTVAVPNVHKNWTSLLVFFPYCLLLQVLLESEESDSRKREQTEKFKMSFNNTRIA